MSVPEKLRLTHLGARARRWRVRLRSDFDDLHINKAFLWIGAALAVLAVIAIIAAFFIDEPLRRRMESNLNRVLKGYTVRIGKLDFHPIGLSLDLEDAVIIQNDNPNPPVAQIPNLTASVLWRAILHGRLVADFEIDEPQLYINRKQAKKEIDDKVPMKERGWQQALEQIYPLKINRLCIKNGKLTYIDEGPFRPLELSAVNFVAEDIRNIRSDPNVYPSPVTIDAVVFGKGRLQAQGHADFLAEPHVAAKSDKIALENIDLTYFKPILDRYDISVRQGSLSAFGNIEYGTKTEHIDIAEIRIVNADAEYVHKSAEPVAQKAGREVDQTAKKYSDAPTLTVAVDKVHVTGKLGFTNAAAKPQYHLFWNDLNFEIDNLTNQSDKKPMTGRARGKFMNSGASQFTFTARPNPKGPDFDLKVAIENTDMTTMNDLWRSYGDFDVVNGQFSFYSELSVRSGNINGYIKPLFQNMDVYDQRQDKDKSIFRKLYEGVIGGLSWILKNPPREEVATTVPVSGKLDNPQTSTWETVVGLVQNAFFKAILPGFERSAQQRR